MIDNNVASKEARSSIIRENNSVRKFLFDMKNISLNNFFINLLLHESSTLKEFEEKKALALGKNFSNLEKDHKIFTEFIKKAKNMQLVVEAVDV